MGNKVYDALRFFALVVLPATSALYFGLGQLWEFPAVEKVVGSIAVIDAVLGTVLTRSSNAWLKKATVAELVTGIDDDGAAEIRTVRQITDAPIMFEDGARVLMQVRHERE